MYNFPLTREYVSAHPTRCARRAPLAMLAPVGHARHARADFYNKNAPVVAASKGNFRRERLRFMRQCRKGAR